MCGSGALVLLGDLNVREEEMGAVRETRGFSEAVYKGKSWDPSRNKFDAELKLRKDVAGHAFDRILFAGGVFVQAYMVGVGRLFSDGVPFCLSDHYGLVGLMDVHEGHAGGGSARGEAGARRMKVSRLRDLACAAEQSYVEEHERDQIRRDKEDQMARAEARILEAQQDMRRAVRQRKDARLALRQKVFGDQALFGPEVEARFVAGPPAPVMPSAVVVEASASTSAAAVTFPADASPVTRARVARVPAAAF